MINSFRNLHCAIVKLTSRCNINCEYCYENITFGRGPHSFMSTDTFKDIVDKMLDSTQCEEFLLILHGGEPSLVSTKWFDECLSYAKNKAESLSKQITFFVQTNLVNISDESLNCFGRHNVQVGVSLDNPDYVSSSMRPLAGKVVKNFFRARDSGLNCSVLLTINSSNIDLFEDICSWLYEDLGLKSFKANVAYSVGNGLGLNPLLPEEIFRAKKSIVDYMLRTKGLALIEHNLTTDIINYVKATLMVRKDRNHCVMIKFVVLEGK